MLRMILRDLSEGCRRLKKQNTAHLNAHLQTFDEDLKGSKQNESVLTDTLIRFGQNSNESAMS